MPMTSISIEREMEFMIKNRFDADLCGYCITKEKMAKLREAGLKINCWTLDSLEHAELAKQMGVDFITTNILE